MIEEYLQRIDALLSASPAVSEVEIIRRSIRDTELEKILHYREGAEDRVVSHTAITGLEALQRILTEIEAQEKSGGREDLS